MTRSEYHTGTTSYSVIWYPGYIDVSSFINSNDSVCGPVALSRRIKQGDSISSQLYIMSIFSEGLLHHWMARLN